MKLPAFNHMRLRAQIVKELLSVLRDPKARMVLVVPPLLQLLVLSFAATLEVRNIDIAVLNQDNGFWSRELIQRVAAAGFVHAVVPVQRMQQLREKLDRREVLAAIRFPPDFSRDIAAGGSGAAQVLVDGRRANSGQIAFSYIDSVARQMGVELRQAQAPPAPTVRHWFNPNLIYYWYVVPSLAGILAMFVSLLVTALSIARERELGTFDQLLVSPATPLEIIIGKTLPALIVGTTLGSLMVVAAVAGFRIPFTGSVLLLELSLMLFILSVVGIGLMVSSICQTQQQAILGIFAIGVPVVLISGFATPVENMPDWLQWVAEASPLKHFLIILQGSFLKALPPGDLLANAWPLAVIAAVTLTSATVFVRRRLQ